MTGPVDPRLLRHARSSRTGIAGLALLGAGQAGATLLLAVALTLLVAGPRGAGTALLATSYAARAALAWGQQVVAQRTAARVADELRRNALEAALRRGPAWVAGYGPGRLAAVLTTGLDALRPWFAGYLPALVLGVALPPLVLVAMAVADPASAVIALLTLPLIPLLGALIGWATQARARHRWAADARLAGHFLDVVQGLATLRVHGRAERQIAVVEAMTDRHRSATMRVLRVAFLSSTALDLVATLSVGLIAVEAGLRVAAGSLGLAPALLVILLAPEAYRPLREMAARFHAAADATAVIGDLDEVLSPARGRPPGPGSADGRGSLRPQTGAVPATPGTAAVLGRGLRVRHPGTAEDALALDDVVVRGGEIVALGGVSGAGKTTALRALAGMQELRAGQVEVSGPRPRYLSQRPGMAHARSVSEVFPPGEDVGRALRAVGLDGEVTARTPLGERGQGVSAGQRQRLALAALLAAARREPVVLLLDEPTAHLDPDTERQVIDQLHAAARRGCAVLVVAHRPALLAAADRIIDVTPPTGSAAGPATDPARIVAAAAGPESTGTPPAAPTGHQLSRRPATGDQRSAGAAADRPTHGDSGARAAVRPAGPVAAGATAAGASAGSPRWIGRAGWAIGFGAASWLAGVLLTGSAAWLLVRASSLPPVLTLSAAVVLVRASAVARPVLRYLERLAGHDVAFARLGQHRAAVYADLVPRVPGPRQTRRGELLSRVAGDVDAVVDGLLRGRFPAWSAGIAIGVASGAAVAVLPAAGPAIAAGLLLAAGIAPAVAGHQAVRREAATARARAALNDAVVETIDGLEDLAAAGPSALDVPRRRSRTLAAEEARAARTAGLATALGHAGWGFAVLGTALTATSLSSEWAAVLLLAVVALGEPLGVLPDAAVARRRAAAAQARLAEPAARPPSATPRPAPAQCRSETGLARPGTDSGPPDSAPPKLGPLKLGHPELGHPELGHPELGHPDSGAPDFGPPDSRLADRRQHDSGQTDSGAPAERVRPGGLAVRGLVAGWEPGRAPALRGLDLDVPGGARVAVLGASGGGKSTLAAVLARLLDPRAGTVTLGGTDLTGLADPVVRRRVGLVSEDADHVFATTVRENLRLARADASDDALLGVQQRVGLGLDLDRWLGAGGSTISGGQRKRLAAARALLADPELLILDEPTEGLDEAGAQALMADLLDAARGRTVLVLTHRTEGLDRMDATYRLVDGAVVSVSRSAAG